MAGRETRQREQAPLRRESIEKPEQADRKERGARTTAQLFCLVGGLTLIAVGVLGFFFGGDSFDSGGSVQGEEFILFEVNGWHNVVHLATGGFLLLMAGTARAAITGAFAFGMVYVAVTVWGFITGDDILGLVPVNTADNFLHLALAVTALLVVFLAGGLQASASAERPGAGA